MPALLSPFDDIIERKTNWEELQEIPLIMGRAEKCRRFLWIYLFLMIARFDDLLLSIV